MIEVEIKLPIREQAKLEEHLTGCGFVPGDLVQESDVYFAGDVRDFRESDEALRIRRSENLTTAESKTQLTYKGPKLDTISMSRKELETEVQDFGVCKEILRAIGFTKLYPVNKLRQYYHLKTMTACVDQVEDLGTFLELEIIVPTEADKKTALEKISHVLEQIGHHMSETTRISYLTMLQDKE